MNLRCFYKLHISIHPQQDIKYVLFYFGLICKLSTVNINMTSTETYRSSYRVARFIYKPFLKDRKQKIYIIVFQLEQNFILYRSYYHSIYTQKQAQIQPCWIYFLLVFVSLSHNQLKKRDPGRFELPDLGLMLESDLKLAMLFQLSYRSN